MATALLIIDMQQYFASMTQTALPNILKLCTHFKRHGLPMIFTQHGHTKQELTPPFINQLVRKWGPRDSIARGSEAWELLPEIERWHMQTSRPAVQKNTYDAFLGTELEQIFKEEGVERVVVCGVMTDLCCDTTARSAFNRGYETWLVDDACGSASKIHHQAGLAGFRFGFGDVVVTEEVMRRVG